MQFRNKKRGSPTLKKQL